MRQHVEPVEARRLFNLAAFGADTTIGTEFAPLAAAPNGSYVIAQGKSVQRYNSNGVAVGSTITTAGYVSQLTLDNGGDIVVAYATSESNTYKVNFQRISGRNRVSDPVTVTSFPLVDDRPGVSSVAISADTGGGFFIGATCELSISRIELRMAAYDANGRARGTVFLADSLDSFDGYASALDISASPDGSKAVYTYFESYDDDLVQTNLGGIVSTSGRTATLGYERTPDHFFVTYSPSVEMLADGSIVEGFLAEDSLHSAKSTSTFFQRYDAAGKAVGDAVLLAAVPTIQYGSYGSSVDVAALAGGGFVVAYVQPDGTKDPEMVAQRFDATGRSDSAAGVIRLSNGVVHDLVASANGNLVATYEDREYPSMEHAVRLTTNVAAVDHSTLYVLGTRRADAMSVKLNGGSLFASVSGDSPKFSASAIKGLDFEGFNGDDVIVNATGLRATVRGAGGNDAIVNGGGNDFVDAGDGNDTVLAGDGDNAVYGGSGNDELHGGSGSDTLWGQNGNDTLLGGNGDDSVDGAGGNDSLDGEGGDDTLWGDAGRDTIDGGSGIDTLYGGDGNDFLVAYDTSPIASSESEARTRAMSIRATSSPTSRCSSKAPPQGVQLVRRERRHPSSLATAFASAPHSGQRSGVARRS